MEFGKSNDLESQSPFQDNLSPLNSQLNNLATFGEDAALLGAAGKWRSMGSSFDPSLNQYASAITSGEQVLNLQLPSAKESFTAEGDILTGVVGTNPLVEPSDKMLLGTSNNANSSIVFIDSSVEDYHSLIASIKPGTEVAVLDSLRNQVEQIGEYLAGRSNISSLHIISHGDSGSLQLGETKFGIDTLNSNFNGLQSWSKSLTADADILLYGCDVAAGEQGAAFVKQLSRITGADVAASTDLTGNAVLGGDWDLEFSTGAIELSQVFQVGALGAYQSTLAVGPDGSGYIATSTSFQPNLSLVPGAAGVVNLSTLSSGDDPLGEAIDLGTNTFRLYGQTYTGNSQLFVSVNGLITFGSGNSTFTNNNLTTAIPQAAIAPVWDDWVTDVNGTPNDLVLYQFQDLNNDSTSDQLVIEWNNVHHFSNRVAGDATFQTILNLNTGSTNGNIIFNYSDLSIPNTNLDEAGSATVGIKAAGSQGSNRLLISQDTTESPYIGTNRAIVITDHTPLLDLNGDQTKDAIGINYTNRFAEGGGAVSIVDSNNLSLITPGSSTLASATITLTNPLDGVAEVLAADVIGTNIAAAYNSTTSTLTLTGADTVTNYQQVLRSITYNNTATNINITDRTINFVVSDGTNTSPVATSTVVPNAPLLDLNGTAPGINYTNFFAPSVVVAAVDSANLILSAPDSPNLSSATVRITNLRNGASEILAANTTGTNIAANYSSGVLNLTGADTVANYQQVLRSITYNNTAANPDTRDRLLNFTVNDGTKTSPVAITTLNFNNLPTISTIANQTINEDNSSGAISFTIGDMETAASALTVTTVSSDQTLIANSGLVLGGSGASRTITINPTANQNGSAALTLRVSDGFNTRDSTFSLTVNPINDAPIVISPISDQTATEESLFSFQVDSNSFGDVDAGDTLTYTASLTDDSALPSWLNFNAADGTFSGTPENDNVGTLNVKVTATDSANTNASDIFSLIVANSNDSPTVSDIIKTINEDTAIAFTTSDFTAAFSDVDLLDNLTQIQITSLPTNGTLILNSNNVTANDIIAVADLGNLSFTPNANFNGDISFTWNGFDGMSYATVGGAVNLSVTSVNDLPVANSDTATTLRAQPVVISAAQLLANDTDIDGGSLSITSFTQPSNGTLVDNGNGTFTYTPDIYFDGTVSFGYTISDGQGGTANSNVQLTVNPEDGIFNLVQSNQFFNTPDISAISVFDESFYLAQNPDVAQAVAAGFLSSGFEHFQLFGQAEDRDPSILFSNALYLENNPDVANAVASGVFQSGFEHFLLFGQNENRDFRALNFDEGFYLENNPDVAGAVRAGFFTNGYEHFLQFGQNEGRNPSVLYDESFYLASNPDVADAVRTGTLRSGFEHLLRFGEFEGRNPSRLFDNARYLADNPEVISEISAGAFRSGFEHFLRVGQFEGRQPDLELFNESFYLANNADVAAAVAAGFFESGFDHFIRFGQAENRTFSELFDESFYLASNSDVAAAVRDGSLRSGFEHYVRFGRAEGRSAVG